jgi:3-(3-hydroxy-phenyl)propionate hydroxylase
LADEGISAGLLDTLALGWRLNFILERRVCNHVLECYTSECNEHAIHYIELSQQPGQIICVTDPEKAAKRDRKMKADPKVRNDKLVSTDVCSLGPGASTPPTLVSCRCRASLRRTASASSWIGPPGAAGWYSGWTMIRPRAPLADRVETVRFFEGMTFKIGAPGIDCEAEKVQGTCARCERVVMRMKTWWTRSPLRRIRPASFSDLERSPKWQTSSRDWVLGAR